MDDIEDLTVISRSYLRDIERRIADLEDDRFYRDGGRFRWCWPKFDRMIPADRRPRVLLNRYPHNVIGVMIVAFGYGWGIRWKAS